MTFNTGIEMEHGEDGLARHLYCRRRPLAKFFAALALTFTLPLGAVAGTVVINDLTDSVFITSDIPSRLENTTCAGEHCNDVKLLAPLNATFTATNFAIVAGPENPHFITIGGDAGGTSAQGKVSDFFSDLTDEPRSPTTFFFSFSSDPVESGTADCTDPIAGPCRIIENGMEQTAFTVTWSDHTVDTIKFVSDVEVPEPSYLLALTGLLSLLILHCWVNRNSRS